MIAPNPHEADRLLRRQANWLLRRALYLERRAARTPTTPERQRRLLASATADRARAREIFDTLAASARGRLIQR
jgi:hypothetical protein